MQVKKFEAPTIAEALALVKGELGPEAIILSTKNNRKGFGLLSNASVEVTAAVSEKSLAKKRITEKALPTETKDQVGKLSATKQAAIFDEFAEHYTRRHTERKSNVQAKAQAAAKPQRYIDIHDEEEAGQVSRTPNAGYGRNGSALGTRQAPAAFMGQTAVHADAQSARSELRSQLPQQPQYAAPRANTMTQAPQRMQAPAAPQAQAQEVTALQEDIQRLKGMLEELKSEQTATVDARIPETSSDEVQVEYQNLLRNGIDKRFATALVKQVTFTLGRQDLSNTNRVIETMAVEMMNNLKMDHPLEFKPGSGQRVLALIGPTGVGKTTTIAKLASQAILQKNLRVGLINVDSYKVAALDQLATYAKILNVPFRQASTAVELDRALAEFKPLDLVLIDTSGRSQKDSDSLTQLKTLLSECAAVRPLLIMSATTRDQELYDIITRFKIFNPNGLIFSKLDETSTFGCIYNVALKTSLPLTYFTVGQRVPEDLEAASCERVVDLILDI